MDGPLAAAAAGDDQDGVLGLQRRAELVCNIAPVGDHALYASSIGHQQVGAPDVGGVATCQGEAEPPADNIYERMDLGFTTAPRDPDGVLSPTPLNPPEQR